MRGETGAPDDAVHSARFGAGRWRPAALLLCAACATRAVPSGTPRTVRSPEIRGTFREGFWAPERPVPGVYFAARYTTGGRCTGPGPGTRTDSAGVFRLPATEVEVVVRRDSAGREPAWYVCIAPFRDTVGGLWAIHRIPPGASGPQFLDCRSHGDAGSPDCLPMSEERRRRLP